MYGATGSSASVPSFPSPSVGSGDRDGPKRGLGSRT